MKPQNHTNGPLNLIILAASSHFWFISCRTIGHTRRSNVRMIKKCHLGTSTFSLGYVVLLKQQRFWMIEDCYFKSRLICPLCSWLARKKQHKEAAERPAPQCTDEMVQITLIKRGKWGRPWYWAITPVVTNTVFFFLSMINSFIQEACNREKDKVYCGCWETIRTNNATSYVFKPQMNLCLCVCSFLQYSSSLSSSSTDFVSLILFVLFSCSCLLFSTL